MPGARVPSRPLPRQGGLNGGSLEPPPIPETDRSPSYPSGQLPWAETLPLLEPCRIAWQDLGGGRRASYARDPPPPELGRDPSIAPPGCGGDSEPGPEPSPQRWLGRSEQCRSSPQTGHWWAWPTAWLVPQTGARACAKRRWLEPLLQCSRCTISTPGEGTCIFLPSWCCPVPSPVTPFAGPWSCCCGHRIGVEQQTLLTVPSSPCCASGEWAPPVPEPGRVAVRRGVVSAL